MNVGLEIVAFNWPGSPANLATKLAEIARTALGTVHIASGAMTAREVIATCGSMSRLGIQHVIFNMPNLHEIVPIEVFAREIIPAVGEF